MIVEDVQDVGFGQNIRKGKPLVAREAGADHLKVGHCDPEITVRPLSPEPA
jgi:hypothetical protein